VLSGWRCGHLADAPPRQWASEEPTAAAELMIKLVPVQAAPVGPVLSGVLVVSGLLVTKPPSAV
jgi:hypothetical protein